MAASICVDDYRCAGIAIEFHTAGVAFSPGPIWAGQWLFVDESGQFRVGSCTFNRGIHPTIDFPSAVVTQTFPNDPTGAKGAYLTWRYGDTTDDLTAAAMWAVFHYYAQDGAGTRRAANGAAALVPSLDMVARASGRDDIQARAIELDAEANRFAGTWALSVAVGRRRWNRCCLDGGSAAGCRRHRHAADERERFAGRRADRRRRIGALDDAGRSREADGRRVDVDSRAGARLSRQAGGPGSERCAATGDGWCARCRFRDGNGRRPDPHDDHDDDVPPTRRRPRRRTTMPPTTTRRPSATTTTDHNHDHAAGHHDGDRQHSSADGRRSCSTVGPTGDDCSGGRSHRRSAPTSTCDGPAPHRKGQRADLLPRHRVAGSRDRNRRCRQPPASTKGHLHSMT